MHRAAASGSRVETVRFMVGLQMGVVVGREASAQARGAETIVRTASSSIAGWLRPGARAIAVLVLRISNRPRTPTISVLLTRTAATPITAFMVRVRCG